MTDERTETVQCVVCKDPISADDSCFEAQAKGKDDNPISEKKFVCFDCGTKLIKGLPPEAILEAKMTLESKDGNTKRHFTYKKEQENE